jgi:BirA family transcriptional regulator, biotin operon repressor / biotin---[acetyl-CoA-carboxylase] ligase
MPNANNSDASDLDVQRLLAASFLADIEHHAVLDSTQDRALALSATGVRGPLLIVAEQQTAGRGRGANRWWTGRGSLAFSLLFEPALWGLPPQAVPMRSLAAGVAVVAAVAPALYPHNVGLHWPNDVFVGGRKLAGILIDVLADGRHVLGLGINVNNSLAAAPADVRQRATSMFDLTNMRHDRTALLVEILAELAAVFQQLAVDPAACGNRFQDLCLQIGKPLVLDAGGALTAGECLGIAADGALLLETAGRREKFYSGVLR